MKKPWQIWFLFGLCLALAASAVVWLSVRTIDLARAEEEARHQADAARQQTELQERIATALWRMDWTMTPLISQEVTRPSFVYQSFFTTNLGGKSDSVRMASPLLTQPSPLVLLHFEISPDNQWNSPQDPQRRDLPLATAAGVSPDTIAQNRERLEELRKSVTHSQLLPLLPEILLSPIDNLGANAEPQIDIAVMNRVATPEQMPQSSWPDSSRGYAQQQAGPIEPQNLLTQQTIDPDVQQLRAQQEWSRRNSSVQNVARNQRAQQFSNGLFRSETEQPREGVSRPVWIDSKLLLARRLVVGDDVRIQGCWLDWTKVRTMLVEDVSDLFPSIDLIPASDDDEVPPGRLLATLPVQLVIPGTIETPRMPGAESSFRAIRASLMIAWSCLVLGAAAIGVLLRGVIALSERRAAFVSAVTHELRTPLTTFRMYAEMLSEGMVQDEKKRNRYLETLRVEAERLSHLVDNVLQYARLERGRNARRRTAIPLSCLSQQCTGRLPERANQAGMELHETIDPDDAHKIIMTDPAAVEQILFNLVDNACKYAATADDRRIHVRWSVENGSAHVRVTDHGPGIQTVQAKKLFKPFSKSDQEAAQSAPGIGLGLALCQRLAVDLGGTLTCDLDDGTGATFLLTLPTQS